MLIVLAIYDGSARKSIGVVAFSMFNSVCNSNDVGRRIGLLLSILSTSLINFSEYTPDFAIG